MSDQEFIAYSMIIAGIAAIIYGFVFVRLKVNRTLEWPGAMGMIISSNVHKQGMNTGYENPNTVYKAKVKYRYEVNGRKYINNVIKPCGNLEISIPGRANAVVQQYKKDDEVMVFYNPDRPGESCLEQTEEVSLFYIGIGVVFIIFGYIF